MTKIEKFEAIVKRGQNNKIDGVRVDLFSAGAVMAVYNALSPENRAKYEAMPVPKMVVLAFKLLKK